MDNHTQRIQTELKQVGVTWYGLQKFSIKYLPEVIGKNEHIGGVVYGRYKEKGGPSFNEGLLVATNLRVVFVDHKPGYTKTDEIAYSAITGARITRAILSSVTLHTRLGDFSIRFANANCAKIFVKYIESLQQLDKTTVSIRGR